ncbi:MAG: formyltetrahydrofolate deformylase [Bacteroidales bacterium]|jgi:formyltetrahydrofolate deformylase|nr:formyltetrahydrofolate deformylase [Bacteroidales bacterium]
METNNVTAILRVSCPDRKGLISRVTDFIQRNEGNIVALDQYTDRLEKHFFMRVEWELEGFAISREEIAPAFEYAIANPCEMQWKLDFSDERLKMCIMVSKLSHCIYDLLARWRSGELDVEIPIIIGNHEEMRVVADQFGIPFHLLKITKENKAEMEAEQMRLLEENKIDFIVLARYMQILSEDFIKAYPERIINIHHSTLPAFVGAKPYHQAYERGVKLIGATGHYVTADLDAGPIIEQDVIRVTHIDTPATMVEKGKDVEKIVLSRAVEAHIARRTLVYKNKTIIFK